MLQQGSRKQVEQEPDHQGDDAREEVHDLQGPPGPSDMLIDQLSGLGRVGKGGEGHGGIEQWLVVSEVDGSLVNYRDLWPFIGRSSERICST